MPPVKALISEPTAPLGTPASSATVSVSEVSASTGASLTAAPVKALLPVTGDATPSLTLVAIVKAALKFVVGVKLSAASSTLTSAIAPLAVHTPVPAL